MKTASSQTENEGLPENLPVEIVEHDLLPDKRICPQCGGDMHVMGREKRRELVIIPAKVKIQEHIRKVYACRDCERDEDGVPINKAPTDEPVIKGGCAYHPIVYYDYQPDRKSKRPKEFLKEFSGYLHTDGYDGYHGLPDDIVIVGCWAHARRKFDEALQSAGEQSRDADNILRGKRYCDRLFALERTFEKLTADERFLKRQELSKPLLDEFLLWLGQLNALPKTPLGRAVRYVLGQRKYLERYLLDGRLEISNNRAERSIKPFVIGRKNFLFANTPRGARASAIMYSIVETAKENGFDPFAYLTYIFKNAPNWDIRNNLSGLQMLMPGDIKMSGALDR